MTTLVAFDLAQHPLLDVLGRVLKQIVYPETGAVRIALDEPGAVLPSSINEGLEENSGFAHPARSQFNIVGIAQVVVSCFIGRVPEQFQRPPG